MAKTCAFSLVMVVWEVNKAKDDYKRLRFGIYLQMVIYKTEKKENSRGHIIVLLLLICLISISCNNKNVNQTKGDDTIALASDSIKKVQARQSIERENLFASMGDTVFGGVRYGVSKRQFKKALDDFIKPLKKDDIHDFTFVGIDFDCSYNDLEERKNIKSPSGISIELERIKKGDNIGTLFFKDRLFSVEWLSFSKHLSKGNIEKLEALLEHKYGKPNYKNIARFPYPGILAKWETKSRLIRIQYDTNLSVHFLDKDFMEEVDKYIDSILRQEEREALGKAKKDSINNANAL